MMNSEATVTRLATQTKRWFYMGYCIAISSNDLIMGYVSLHSVLLVSPTSPY